MKKIIYSLLVLAMAAFTFSSCEDVPAPYDMPTKPETPELQPTGSGTAADPFNIAAVEKYIDEGGSAETEIYVKGKVVSVKQGSFDPQYGSLKYYISEDGTATNQFYVYNGYAGPNRTKFSGEDALKPGDEVVICGKVDNYQGTKEFLVGNYIVSLNGQGGTTTPDTPAGEAKGTGTEADPFNSVAANNLATSLGSGEVSDKEYYIKGKIQEIKDQFAAQFGNATFYIADDENSQKFLIFRTYYFGGEKWKEGDGQLKIGDEVVVCAKLINYMGNTPETNQGGKLISVNGKTSIEGGSETPDTPSTTEGISVNGLTVTLTNSGVTAGKSLKVEDLSTLKLDANPTEFTLSDGTIFKLDSNGNKTKPAYNEKAKELRIYANNIMTITGSKNIAKIILTCTHDHNKNTDCVGNETATINFSGKTATYTNVFTGTTGGGVQLRIKSIEIVYAK